MYSFTLGPPKTVSEICIESVDDPDTWEESSMEIDERMIDFELFDASPEHADKIYKELIERAIRQRKAEAKEHAIEEVLNEDEIEDDEDQYG